ncbi:MAG TPA: hypothetical protein VFO70_03890 [Chitinophagaceae bacterium]|nr:hypothetical protein [Chitinophagaceae bacterium]
MGKLLGKITILTFAFASIVIQVRSQTFENPGQYMDYIGKANEKVTSMYLSYLSAVGHNKSARKVDKRRQEVINTIYYTRVDIQGMAPWKGDRTLRDTSVAYFKLLYNVFNEDYAKIVNMEEIAEQSYDAMEAYMLAQEKAGEKLVEATAKQQRTQKIFADKYNVTLLESTSELDQKSKQASELMKHYDEVYLIFFKAYKQEGYLMDAIGKKNIIAIEQNKSALQKFAEEGMQKLKTLKGYNNDASLIVACREALVFYKDEAEKAQFATDFLLKEEAFAKMKKAFDSKPASKRTEKDIYDFNNGVNEINGAVNSYNNTNNQFNKERDKILSKWNNAVKRYLDDYTPFQRKG